MSVKVIIRKKIIYVYLLNKLFFYQPFLISKNSKMKNSSYTYYYVLLKLYKFGLKI